MSQIEELQTRLTTAMERIGAGADTIQSRAAATREADSEMKQALEAEKLANAQLEERLASLKARHAEEIDAMQSAPQDTGEVETLRRELDDQARAMSQLDQELQKVRAANDQLRAANAALRSANSEGVGDASLINQGLEAEIDSLRAARDADLAETGAILSRLEPLLSAASIQLTDDRTENKGDA